MKFRSILATAAGGMLLAASSAQALTYATSVYSERTDTTVSTADKNADREDPANALGVPDATKDPLEGFFSLGLGKYADFTFGTDFVGEGKTFEVTLGASSYLEYADIYVYNSDDGFGSNALVADNLVNTDAQPMAGVSFTFAGTWDTLRIIDDTEANGGTLGDGWDVDAVGVQAVPLPAAAWLLLGVSGALVGAKRRQARKAA